MSSADLSARSVFQHLHARPVSGEHLEVLGKNASAMYRSGRVDTLTDSVIETVKHAGLSPEQVQRVIEFANTEAFLTDFKKEGAGHRVVDLQGGPANPSEVFKALNVTGGERVFDRGTRDYDQPPREKKASDARVEESLKLAFQGSGAEYEFADPLAEAYDTQEKLASAQEHMTSELSTLEVMFEDLTERLFNGVKQASLGGMSLGQVVQAWAEAEGANPEYVKVAFAILAPRLVKNEVFRSGNAITASLEKVGSSHVIVNTKHPLVVDFGEFCETLGKMAEVRAAREEINLNLGRIKTFLKHAAAGGDGLVRKLYEHTEGAGKAVRPLAEGATRLLLGPTSPHARHVGWVAEKAVKHLPTAAALLGGNEVRRELKYSPTYQGAKNTALQFVPGTPQYQQREYELASSSMGPGQGYGY